MHSAAIRNGEKCEGILLSCTRDVYKDRVRSQLSFPQRKTRDVYKDSLLTIQSSTT